MEGETHSSPISDIEIVVDYIKNNPRCTAKNLSEILGWDLRRVQKILKILSESFDPSIKNYKIQRFPPERSTTGFTYTVIDENEAKLSELLKSEESQNKHISVQKETAAHLTKAAQEILETMQKIPGQIYTAKNIKNIQQCSLDTAQRILNSIFKAYPNQIHKRCLQKTGEYEYSYTAITDLKTEVRDAPIVKPIRRTVHPTKEESPIPKDSI